MLTWEYKTWHGRDRREMYYVNEDRGVVEYIKTDASEYGPEWRYVLRYGKHTGVGVWVFEDEADAQARLAVVMREQEQRREDEARQRARQQAAVVALPAPKLTPRRVSQRSARWLRIQVADWREWTAAGYRKPLRTGRTYVFPLGGTA